ncbi:MAG: hypothetical protein MI922_00910, partial [Bacteroidales bacterium]|nr:hypothetical protein [Bacteroidales bacterium]
STFICEHCGFYSTSASIRVLPFTYYMCAGLKGNADINNDRVITMGELYQYLKQEVMFASKKIRGVQTPQFYGDPNKVLVEF